MKIAIIGYSGSGKSTLAYLLAKEYNIDVLHFDTVHFLPNWKIRCHEEKERITKDFLDTHEEWVVDGNYSNLFYERRMAEADMIILLLFNRFSCFWRAYRRYLKYKNRTRSDMADGCNEKFDLEFARWILWRGRTKRKRERYKRVVSQYGQKAVVIKNQRQLNSFIDGIKKPEKIIPKNQKRY